MKAMSSVNTIDISVSVVQMSLVFTTISFIHQYYERLQMLNTERVKHVVDVADRIEHM